jgi:MFS family permease
MVGKAWCGTGLRRWRNRAAANGPPPHPPGRRHPIAREAFPSGAFAWFLLASFFLNFSNGAYAPLLPDVVSTLGLSLAAAGFLGTAFSLPRSLLALPAGLLAERIGPTRIMHAGMSMVLAGTLVTARASSMGEMVLARALIGLGYGSTSIVAIVYLMRAGPADHRTRRGNMYEGALITGNAVSGYLVGEIAARAGWRWGFGTAAVAAGLGWLTAAWRVFPAVRAAFREPAPAPGPEAPRGPSPRAHPYTLPAIYLAVLGLAFGWAGMATTLAPLYGSQALGLGSAAIGRAFAVGYIVEGLLLIPVGWAADTFGRLRVLLPGMAMLVAGTALLPLAGGAAGYTVACGLFIAGMSVWMIPASLLAEHRQGRFGGREVGTYRLMTDLAMVAAPVTVGTVTGWGGFGLGAAVVALVMALAGGVTGVVLGMQRSGRGRR